MFRFLFSLFLAVPAFSATCADSNIIGVFPKINGFSCTDYALFIGFVGLISAYIFWEQVTK